MGVIGDTLGSIGYALDTPGAYTRGLLAGKPGKRVGGREMLQSWGAVGENTPGLDFGDVAGFGAEMLVDPLNLIGAGWLGKLANANKGIAAGNRASQAMRAAGAMPAELVPKLHPSVIDQATGMPKRFYHGTPQAFDRFDSNLLNEDSLFGKGVYLTDSPTVASSYAKRNGTYTTGPADPVKYQRVLKLAEKAKDKTSKIMQKKTAFNQAVHDKYGGYDYMSKLSDAELGQYKNLERRVDHTAFRGYALEDAAKAMKTTTVPHPQNVRMHYVDARNPFLPDELYPIDEINRIARTKLPQADYSSHGTSILGDTFATAAAPSPEFARQQMSAAGYDSIAHLGGQRIGGLGDHNVAIAFDPSQVYAPYIAPALQQTRSMLPPATILGAYNAAKQFRNRRQSQ